MSKSSARVSESEPKEAETMSNGSQQIPEGNQKKLKTSQKVANMRKNAPKLSLGAFVCFCFFMLRLFRQNGEHGRGTLVGLTRVKGTSVDIFSVFLKS